MMFNRVFAVLVWLVAGGVFAAQPHSDVRIASPWPAQNTIITMLGYGDNIVGTSMVAKKIPLFRQSLPRIDDVAAVSVNSGHELDPEQIISLGTQLLFVPKSMTVPKQALLELAGVRVLAFEANSMPALTSRIQKTADVLGPDAQEKAKRYQHYFEQNVALVKERLKDVPPNERVAVYHSMGNPLTTTGKPSLNQDWMELAGARNIAENWFTNKPNRAGEVPLERIVAANPAVIVAMNKRDADTIMTSPQWSQVDAVLNHRVYVNPKGMFWWCRETSEEAMQFLWLAKMLYPQRFADVDMNLETRHFYQQFFGITLNDAQINDVLNPPK